MERIKTALNGCFDLFHAGHRYIIHKSLDIIRPKDVLVALNTDKSIRLLKGGNRPRVHLTDRADSIQRSIDEWCTINLVHVKTKIVPFDTEEQLAEIFAEFEPTVIVKGNDRPDIRTIVGTDRWPIIIIPRLCDQHGDDISTSNILDNGYK